MDGRAVLLAQVGAAEADLDAVEAMVRAPAFNGFPERDEILARLRAPIETQRGKLALARTAETSRAWGLLDSARLGSVTPLEEALALLGGMLMREAKLDGDVALDGDVSLMAHVLQREMKQRLRQVAWPMASVPGVAERYHRVSQLIRIRFPDRTIWSLPVVAHEVGHAVVSGFAEVAPGTSDNRLAFQVEYPEASQRELVCDVIATLALGPAYVSSCLLLRFDPSTAHEPFAPHPPERERAAVMLAVLRATGPADSADRLGQAWLSALGSARPGPGPDATATLGTAAADILAFTTARLPDLTYNGMDRAVALAVRLERGEIPDAAGTTMVDALNAAWLVRRWGWGAEGILDPGTDQACHELCRAVAKAAAAKAAAGRNGGRP